MKKSILTTFVALALSSAALHAADAVLTGNYLQVGVNNSGGLIDSAFQVGITYDKTGTATFPPYDFLKPGTPYEFGAVGVNGQSTSYGYVLGNSIGSTTTNTSSGTTLSASSTGGTFNGLAISQSLAFSKNGGTIYFDVKLTNTTDTTLSKVVYARGLDPDQDVYAGGGYQTSNAIVNPNLVTGTAPTTDWTIGIFSDSSIWHNASIRADWSSDPYSLLNANNDGYGDWTINMAWNIGDLAAGATADVTFEYRIAPTKDEVVTPPGTGVPDAASTLGLTLGAIGLLGLVRRRR